MNNQGAVNSAISQAQAQGQALQNQYNQQAGQQYGVFQNSQNQANQAYQNYQNYNNTLGNYGDKYGQYLTGAQQMYGFNPADLLQANKTLANTQTTLANLPQAVQQQGNYYGTTAGAQTNNYANQAGSLQAVLAGQTNAVNAYKDVLGATQNQANQQATLGLQGEQLKSQNYSNLYQNSVSQMQTAGQVLNQLQTLQQQQGYVTAQQVKAYQDAYSQYVSAQAAATQASAAMIQAQAQAAQINQQISAFDAYKNSPAYQNYLGNGTNITIPGGNLQGGNISVQGSNYKPQNFTLNGALQGGGMALQGR